MQGLGGAIVSAVAFSLIMLLFTEPAERAKAMGVSASCSRAAARSACCSAACSPTARLALDLPGQHPDRRRRLRAVAAAAAAPRTGRRCRRRLDVAGAVTVTVALMLAVYAIVNGNENGWTSAETLGLLGAAAVAARGVPA